MTTPLLRPVDKEPTDTMPAPAHPPPAPAHVAASSRAEHTDLALRLYQAAQPLAEVVEAGLPYEKAREDMAGFLLSRLITHLTAEEEGILTVAAHYEETRLLAEALRAEQRAIAARVKELMDAASGWEAVAAVRAIHALLAVHTLHVDDVLMPALASRHREAPGQPV